MKKTYYLFNPGRMSRKDNTLKFIAVDEMGREAPPKYLPVENVEALYIFGSVDANSAMYNFLGKKESLATSSITMNTTQDHSSQKIIC